MEKVPLGYQGCLQRFSASNGSWCFYLLPPGFVCVSVAYSEFHCLHLNLSHWSLEVFLWFPLFYLDGFIIQSFYLILDNEWKMVSHSFSWSCLISCNTYWYNLWHLNLWPQLLSLDSSMPCVYLAFRFLDDSFVLCFGDVTLPWFSTVTFL